jgi:hypothetical protein
MFPKKKHKKKNSASVFVCIDQTVPQKNAAAQTGGHHSNHCKEDQTLRGGERTLWWV